MREPKNEEQLKQQIDRESDHKLLSDEQRVRAIQFQHYGSGRSVLKAAIERLQYPSTKDCCRSVLYKFVSGYSCTGYAHEALVNIKPDWRDFVPYLQQIAKMERPPISPWPWNEGTLLRCRILAISLLGRMRAVEALPMLRELATTSRFASVQHTAGRVIEQLESTQSKESTHGR